MMILVLTTKQITSEARSIAGKVEHFLPTLLIAGKVEHFLPMLPWADAPTDGLLLMWKILAEQMTTTTKMMMMTIQTKMMTIQTKMMM